MPHRLKRPQQQHHRRLPYVAEEPDQEDQQEPPQQDDADAPDPPSKAHARIRKDYTKKQHAETAPIKHGDGDGDGDCDGAGAKAGMVAKGKLDRSPLPLRRALITSVVAQRCGPSTPVPSWKISENPFFDAMAAVSTRTYVACAGQSRTHCIAVSARKLAATLWELQGTPAYRVRTTEEPHDLKQDHLPQVQEIQNPKRGSIRLHSATSPLSSLIGQRSLCRSSVQYKGGDNSKKQHPAYSHVLRLLEKHTGRSSTKPSIKGEGQINTKNTSHAPIADGEAIVGDATCQPRTTNELLKVLNQIWALEEQHNSNVALVATLKTDLANAVACVQELTLEQKSHRSDIERLTKQLADEKIMRQEQEQEAVRLALKPLREELEDEKKLKRKLEVQHKKVAKELAEVKKLLAKALQDLEREQKARELMEDVCDELAREIGEDKAQVEELKRESAKVKKEVEEERKMLQMAEVWREERVQMKLAEARLELEEKNATLDRLRSELEAFLKAKRSLEEESCNKVAAKGTSDTGNPNEEGTNMQTEKTATVVNKRVGCEAQRTSQLHPGDDEGSLDEEFHSFELNKDSLEGSTQGKQQNLTTSNHQEVRQVEKGISPAVRMSRLGQQGRSGLERPKGSLDEASERMDSQVDSQWIDRSIKRGELRDWIGERRFSLEDKEGTHSPWQSDGEESHHLLISGSRRKAGRNQLQGSFSNGLKYEATATGSDVFDNNAGSRLPTFEPSVDSKLLLRPDMLQPVNSHFTSPSHQWALFHSSQDQGSPGRATRTSNEMPKITKDNSLKAKLLEAKLEGQQAKVRSK